SGDTRDRNAAGQIAWVGRYPAAAAGPAQAAARRGPGSFRRPWVSRGRHGRNRGTGRRQQARALPALSRQAGVVPRAAGRERGRVGGDRAGADMISQFIREDAGLSNDEAHLLGMALVGMAQVSSRYWLSTGRAIPKDAAEQLLARLAWRGISGWPRTTCPPPPPA